MEFGLKVLVYCTFARSQVTLNEIQKHLMAQLLQSAWNQDVQDKLLETDDNVE